MYWSFAISFVHCGEIGWTPPKFFSQEWSSHRFPNLKDLMICTPGLPYSEAFVRQFPSSLVSLTIVHNLWIPFSSTIGGVGLGEFCKMLRNFASLQDLTLDAYHFNIKHLIIFANTLPRLCSLHVRYFYLRTVALPAVSRS